MRVSRFLSIPVGNYPKLGSLSLSQALLWMVLGIFTKKKTPQSLPPDTTPEELRRSQRETVYSNPMPSCHATCKPANFGVSVPLDTRNWSLVVFVITLQITTIHNMFGTRLGGPLRRSTSIIHWGTIPRWV